MYTDPSGHLPAWTGPSTGKLIGNSIKNLANSVTVQSGKSSSVVGNSIRNLVSNTVDNRTKPLVAGAPKAAMDALRDTTGKALSGIVSSWKTAGKEQGTSAGNTASETYIQNKMDVVWQKIQEFACGSAKEVMAASIDQDSFLDNYFRFAKNQSIGVGVSLYVDLLEPFYEIKGAIEEIFTGSRNGYWADISDLNSVERYIATKYVTDEEAYYLGRIGGDGLSTLIGAGMTLLGTLGALAGLTGDVGGIAATLTGAGAVVGVPVTVVSAVVTVGGVAVTIEGGATVIASVSNLEDNYKNYKEAAEEDKGDSGSNKNKIPDNDSTTGHIFRDAEGHIPDTPENRALLEDVANDPANFRGTDKYGNEWYTKIQSDGSQVWVESRNGNIFEGGVNNIPKPWNSETGLKKP